ncbi:unnamed protein product [Sphenostylis stenocarpa]|uniref:Uncharacterized protein n=1 Tax=Sphenostylis stenocarpa TaxID=92480 RepID=A0AA86T5S5_9FABA|nr:unnamed protein product [Sphenostylis stenocarpa]
MEEVIRIRLVEPEEEETPITPLVCFKREDMKRFEETEECFILDFDPYDSFNFSKVSLNDKNSHHSDAAQDVHIVGENGKVACRDYPHPRHLCLKFPFTTTPHRSYCEMCYCCVCDEAAPCKQWTRFTSPHCDASARDGYATEGGAEYLSDDESWF